MFRVARMITRIQISRRVPSSFSKHRLRRTGLRIRSSFSRFFSSNPVVIARFVEDTKRRYDESNRARVTIHLSDGVGVLFRLYLFLDSLPVTEHGVT
jgi:hypothetical protein